MVRVCVGVLLSSASLLCEYMSGTTQHYAEHRPLQAQTIRGARSQPLPPIDPDSSSGCHI